MLVAREFGSGAWAPAFVETAGDRLASYLWRLKEISMVCLFVRGGAGAVLRKERGFMPFVLYVD